MSETNETRSGETLESVVQPQQDSGGALNPDVQPKALPYPREDGICCDCIAKPAVTTDRRFCLKCLRRRIKEETPITSTTFSEERGRKGARSSQVLGGTTDMTSTDDME